MSHGAPPEKQFSEERHKDNSRRMKKKLARLPHLITTGVMIVNMAVDRIPKLSVYLPPNFSDKIPPGM
jgi:hypothetical protein